MMSKHYKIDFHIIGQFYMQTAYDLETDDEKEIKEYIADMEGCNIDDIELMEDSLKEMC